MKKENLHTLRIAVIFLFFLSFFMVGSCDVEFGNSDDNNGGGGNGGSSDPEIVQGTIVDIIPDADIEGILVIVTNEDNSEFSDTTNNSGFFSISSGQGTFSGTPQLEFFDTSMNSLALITITVFPTAEVELGNIILESGTVIFTQPTDVKFKGDVITNNCSGNSGTMEVEAKREGESTDVIVQISASTDIIRDNDDILCEDVLIGQTVEVRGELLVGNTVDADIVDVL